MLGWTAVLALVLAIASRGGDGPETTALSSATSTAASTGTSATTTAGVITTPAAPLPPHAVTRDDLPGMVLSEAAIHVEFPFLQLSAPSSGYRDNDEAAEVCVNPNDTASELAAQGRLDGYALEFADPAAFTRVAVGLPISATVSVALFVTPEFAQASLQREFTDIDRFFGSEVSGITLKEFQQLDAPGIGSNAVAGRLTFTIAALNSDATSNFVSWQRGTIVASLGITALLDEEDRRPALERLAMLVDERIEGVLTGRIIVVAPLQSPTPTPTPSPSPIASTSRPSDELEEVARLAGFDLKAMVTALSELPGDANLTTEGFQEQPGTISTYSREFTSQGAFMTLGLSRVANVGASVQLHPSEANAAAQVALLESIGAQQFAQALASGFAGGRGSTAESVGFDNLDLPPIGDHRAGFLVEFEIAGETFQGHFVYVAQGQILSQLLLIGPEVAVEDTVALVRLMEARIRDGMPE